VNPKPFLSLLHYSFHYLVSFLLPYCSYSGDEVHDRVEQVDILLDGAYELLQAVGGALGRASALQKTHLQQWGGGNGGRGGRGGGKVGDKGGGEGEEGSMGGGGDGVTVVADGELAVGRQLVELLRTLLAR